MATSKPDIMIILLSKLIEEGDSFYKVGQQLVVQVPISDGTTLLERSSNRTSSLPSNRRGR